MNKLQLLNSIHRRATKYADGFDDCMDKQLLYDLAIKNEFIQLDKVMKLMPRLDELLAKNNICVKSEKIDENLYWITLRPSTDHAERFAEFKIYVEKNYLSRAMFLSTTYVWEQKGENIETMGTGFHIHILASLTKHTDKYHLLRNTKSTFNKFLRGECPDAFVEIKKVDTLLYKNNLLYYISGMKKSTDEVNKEPAVLIDIPFRAKYNLETFYTTDASIQDQLFGIIKDNTDVLL